MFRVGFCTYIATNKRNGTLYTGHTDNGSARALQHAHGTFDGFAKTYGCRHIVWLEEHDSRNAAFTRERRIKEWTRAWKLKLIETCNPHWVDIFACPVWPLPDPERWPDLRAQCLAFALAR